MKATLPAVVAAAVLAGFRALLTSPDMADVRDCVRALVREEVRAALAERDGAARRFLDEQAAALRQMGETGDGD